MSLIPQPKLADFPLQDVINALEDWWGAEQEDAALPGDDVAKPSGKSILSPTVEIDSHRAVRALISVEEVIGISVPETVIKEGGYDDFEQMKNHIVPKIQAVFEKERKKQNA